MSKRSLGYMAGGVASGIVSGADMMNRARLTNAHLDLVERQKAAWKKIGDYLDKYKSMQPGNMSAQAAGAPRGLPANQIGVSADQIKGADNPQDLAPEAAVSMAPANQVGVSADQIKGADNPQDLAPAAGAERVAAMPFVRSLSYLGDQFGENDGTS